MISLMFALIAAPTLTGGQSVQATLQSCVVENGRYVCRYAVPDILIVPVPGEDIVADAPDVILGEAPSAEEAPAGLREIPPATEPSAPPVATPPAAVTLAEPGPARPIDTGVLTESEARLVARCADAGWMSLCLPDDRRAARSLRDKQVAYLAVRREVTRLLAADRCETAVTTALDSGNLALAREAREYCAQPATGRAAAGED